MNNYEREYSKIVNVLIRGHFPKLKSKGVIIKEIETLKYRAHVKYGFSGLYIYMSTQLRKFPNWKIRRILIHELCHLEIFLKWGIIRTKIDWIIYLVSKKHRLKDEREANLLMLKKGFGKLILTTIEENKKKGLEYTLTEKEVKDFLKNGNRFRN
jgi:hypothetical protein